MACPIRTYPFRKPKIHRVPIPRWSVSLPNDIKYIYTSYIGVQDHSRAEEATRGALQVIRVVQDWLKKIDGPEASESFVGIELCKSNSRDIAIWVCYWSDPSRRDASVKELSLPSLHSDLAIDDRTSVGIWQESFVTEVSRLETNYSGLDYLPGLAQLPGASTREHTLSAYWGAARDRIPDSAHDLFPRVADIEQPHTVPRGLGQHLVGTNHANMVHIRSGQFWENCGQQEADAYEGKLEPTLQAGLRYLDEHSKYTGAIGIRYLRNKDWPAQVEGHARKETCGAGFFSNLEDLEKWAHTHKSHLNIYRGALSHYKEFGATRRFRTWHEVSVIRQGDGNFEYINCASNTGALRSLQLVERGLDYLAS